MHRLMAGVTILEHELSELRLLVERQTGVLLDCPNSALAAHVADYLEKEGIDSPAALLSSLRAADLDPAALAIFLDGVLNANTGFFRHPGAMNALARHVMPQLYSRKSYDGPCSLRLWSAGCGTGEEAYSIAMALCESMSTGNGSATNSSNGNGNKESKNSRNGGVSESSVPPTPVTKDWSVHIVGSDLLPSAIKTAERGLIHNPHWRDCRLPSFVPAFRRLVRRTFRRRCRRARTPGQSMVLETARQCLAIRTGRICWSSHVCAAWSRLTP